MSDDFDDIRAEAMERCDEIAEELLGAPTERDRREMRWGKHGSISLDLGPKRGVWFDFSENDGGDIIKLVMREQGLAFPAAMDWIRALLGRPAHERPVRRDSVRADDGDDMSKRIAGAKACYNAGRRAGALGEGYFAARGLDLTQEVRNQLRLGEVWFRGFAERELALLMPFRNCITHEIQGVHKIALEAAHEGKRVKRSAGKILGCAMMLAIPKQGRLAICEGLETGVAITMGDPGMPVWALSGASFMAGFWPIKGIKHLFIYADNDANGVGQQAANECSRLWSEHADVTIVKPKERGRDFADIWRRK